MVIRNISSTQNVYQIKRILVSIEAHGTKNMLKEKGLVYFNFKLNIWNILCWKNCRIDLFDLAGTHVDMYPYSVANVAISNLVKLKIMTIVSSIPKNPTIFHHRSWLPSVPSLLYPYLYLICVHISRTFHMYMFFLKQMYFLWSRMWTFLCARPYYQ